MKSSIPKGMVRDHLHASLLAGQLARLKRAAQLAGLTLSEYVRSRLFPGEESRPQWGQRPPQQRKEG